MKTPTEPLDLPGNPTKSEGPSPAANFETGLPSVETLANNAAAPPENQSFNVLRLSEFAERAPVPLNPIDLTSYALTEEFHAGVAKKLVTTVPVRKPAREAFIRTQPDPNVWRPFSLIELKEDSKFYLLYPPVAGALQEMGETTLIRAHLVPAVDRRGNVFLWPLKISDRDSTWHTSARKAAELAKERWVRVQANMSSGCYDTYIAENQEAEPVWPEEAYNALLEIAFEGRVIKAVDHPVLLELRGKF